jgi:hypothetical protein
MGNETSALVRPPPDAAAENDYQSVCDAISASARGRAFLAEYARRNRHADTEVLLAALDRLEARLRDDGTALERLRDELRMLLFAIRLARPDIEAASPLTKTAKLAKLLALLERRIDAMVEGKIDAKPAGPALPAETIAAETPPAPSAELNRPPLSVVPPADEPELPIPSPASPPQPPIALVRPAVTMPDVAFIESASPKPDVIETVAPAPIALPIEAAVEAIVPAPKAAAALPPLDPLAPIMALSEDERIALFT